MISTNAFDYINVMDKAADASWKRETVLANNLANADTPYFKRSDVDFETALKNELGRSKFTSLHKRIRSMNGDLSGLDVDITRPYDNYSYRLGRNNVDPDSEEVELASEQLRYQLLTTAVSDEFARMKVVLK